MVKERNMHPRLSLPYLAVRAGILAAAVVLSLATSCRGGHAADVASGIGATLPATPLALPLRALAARGDLEVRTAAGWTPLASGHSASGVREARSQDGGALLQLGEGILATRVWLRANSRLRLAQDHRGVFVALEVGAARVADPAGGGAAFVADHAGLVEVDGGDVLMERGQDGSLRVVPTGARPTLADWSLALEGAAQPSGVGRLEASAHDEHEAHGDLLALRRVSVEVHTEGDLAVTSVEHVFYNPSSERREGTFRFPLPDGALLTGLAMEIDGKLMEGAIVERDKAREIYQRIVDQMQDPALLEWEAGNWFKLRVFPIEPQAEKRVVIRYAAPLGRTLDGWAYAYSVATPDLEAEIGQLEVTVNGELALARSHVAHGIDLTVPVAESAVPVVMREQRKEGSFVAVRIAPDWAKLGDAPTARPAARRVLVVFDTSRSSLEGHALAVELLRTTLAELGAADRFLVLASDVTVRPHAKDFVAVDEAAIAAAASFVDGIEPDGASDLGAAIDAAAASGATDVVYIGDGVPTWGETEPRILAAQAERSLKLPVHAALVGKGASSELWSDVAGRTGGRVQLVRSELDARRFALAVGHASDARRLVAARVSGPDGVSLYPTTATTLFDGDELVAVLHTPAGKKLPRSLMLRGKVGDKLVSQAVSLAGSRKVGGVAQRWAAREMAARDAAGAGKDEIVLLSQQYGVLSRYTSLLVLESEEAYAENQIKRQAEAEAAQAATGAPPQVTGGDLDSLAAADASLSPDEVQPGDPEIKIPAPADAQQVLVSFPFGETKVAVWDDEIGAWMVRFLIDKDTADGDYQVRITITHADGHVEVRSLSYTVDTEAPAVRVTAVLQGDGYLIKARQVVGRSRRKDLGRVEVLLPDGTVLALVQTARGRFEGRWQPPTAVEGPLTLRVMVRDHALNQAVTELVVE